MTDSLISLYKQVADPFEDPNNGSGVFIVDEDSTILYVTEPNPFGYSFQELHMQKELGDLMEIARRDWHRNVVRAFVLGDGDSRKMQSGIAATVFTKPDSKGERGEVKVTFGLFRTAIAGQKMGIGNYREMPKEMVVAIPADTVAVVRKRWLWIAPVVITISGIIINWRNLTRSFTDQLPSAKPPIQCDSATTLEDYKECLNRYEDRD